MSDAIESTWATRELPILRATLRRFDAGRAFPEVEEIRQEVGLSSDQMYVALRALHDAGYVDVVFAGGWTDTQASGNIERVHERTRRELGSWPSAPDVVDRLVAALLAAAEQATEPEQKSKLRATADVIAGMARDVAVGVIAAQIGAE